jgi:hypothetical protein
MSELQLQHRLQEETPAMTAGEGLTGEQRSLIQVMELRKQIKTLKDREEDLTKMLKEYYRETGEIVATDAITMSMENAVSKVYDEDGLALVMPPDLWHVCQSFDKSKLEGLIKAGVITEQAIVGCVSEKVTERLMIREVKP